MRQDLEANRVKIDPKSNSEKGRKDEKDENSNGTSNYFPHEVRFSADSRPPFVSPSRPCMAALLSTALVPPSCPRRGRAWPPSFLLGKMI